MPSYEILRLSLKYKKPKIAFIDVQHSHLKKNGTKQSFLHDGFDAFPLSLTKINVILDGFSDNNIDDVDILELLNPFSLYHSRWSDEEITVESVFNSSRSREFGAESRKNVAVPNSFRKLDESKHADENDMPWLEKFITYCKQNNIIPVVFSPPFPASDREQMVSNAAMLVAKKYGVPYLDLLREGVIDFKTDCYDKNSHLNPSGARKVTEYVGKYIRENFNLEDHRNDFKYFTKWNKYYQEYKEMLCCLIIQILRLI